MPVSTKTDDTPKNRDLTDCDDPLRPVQKYMAYYHQRYLKGQRPKPPTFKETMSTTWPESYLMSGYYKKTSG